MMIHLLAMVVRRNLGMRMLTLSFPSFGGGGGGGVDEEDVDLRSRKRSVASAMQESE